MTTELSAYTRLSDLGDRIRQGVASQQEKDEFMEFMHDHGKIASEQYQEYLSGSNTEKIINAALSVGAVVLISFLLDELFSRK
jgi:hypothetical protein